MKVKVSIEEQYNAKGTTLSGIPSMPIGLGLGEIRGGPIDTAFLEFNTLNGPIMLSIPLVGLRAMRDAIRNVEVQFPGILD